MNSKESKIYDKDIETVIYSCDREENYLEQTLIHLAYADVPHVYISQGSLSYGNVNRISSALINRFKSYHWDYMADINVLNSLDKPLDVRELAQLNYISALRHRDFNRKYKLILEDDVQASKMMKPMLEHYIQLVESAEGDKPFFLSLYTPYIPAQNSSVDAYKINIDHFYGLQACLMSTSLQGDFAEYIKDRLATEPHDFLIKSFCKERGINIWAVSHSLFQHIGVKTTGLGFHHTAENFIDNFAGTLFLPENEGVSDGVYEGVNDGKRILICGEFQCKTGFATVVRNIAKQLYKDFKVSVVDISCVQDFWTMVDGIPTCGRVDNKDEFAIKQIKNLIKTNQVDSILFVNDIWNIDKMLEDIKLAHFLTLPDIVIYFPVDSMWHHATWYKHLDIVTKAVTYTEFAIETVYEALNGFVSPIQRQEVRDKLSIISHGVDTSKFFKIQDKNLVREKLFGSDKFNGSIIFLNANRNQPRKRLDITMRAFAQFCNHAEENGDMYDYKLYMHSAIVDSHINTYELGKRLGILDKLIFSTPIENPTMRPNATDEEMNLIYNACDIGINTSIGEGYGLCSVEHAMTGAPQIVPCHSACEELFTEAEGEFIRCSESIVQDGIMTLSFIPNLQSTVTAIKRSVDNFEFNRKNVADKFIPEDYDWSGKIGFHWRELFSHLKKNQTAL